MSRSPTTTWHRGGCCGGSHRAGELLTLLDSDLIRRQRQALGLSERDVTKRLVVTGQVISSLERGDNHEAVQRGDAERIAYCRESLHIRDTVTGQCLECGDIKDAAEEAAELRENEPPRGDLLMADGPTGTAWQRYNSDGLWHSTTGKRAPWRLLMKADRPGARTRLVYLPPRPTE
jgi:transcriptional regulator with XRE-family HTH domain